MKTSSSWEWENLVLFPGNGGQKSTTGDCKVKEEPTKMAIKQDSSSAGGFLRIQGGHNGRSPSPRVNRTPAVPEEKRLHDNDDEDEEEVEEEDEEEEEVEEKKKQKQKHGGVVTVAVTAGSGDSVIGLKLGKRTYFESVKAIPASAPSPSPSIPSGKKQRAVMQGTQVPRCQVEGCKTELTGAKDYHRRHKVCELHSKSPKVTVAGIEQRFCQQCSRFHILSEFDEGKRSCRRRLAGHNERRRKPQPDSLAISPARFASTFYDDRRLGSILMDRSPFMHSRFSSSSILGDSVDFKLGYGKGYWPRGVKSENQSPFDGQVTTGSLSRYNADKLLFFLQGSNKTSVPVDATAINQDIHQYMQSSGSHVGQALTLSSSSSGDDLAGLSGASGNLSGVSDSGCALSLLSSNSWSSRATGSASFDHMDTRAGVTTMDQLIQDTQSQPPPLPPPPMAQPLVQQQHHQGVQHNFGLVTADKLLTICSQAPSTGFPVTSVNSMGKEHHGEPLLGGVGNYEGHVFGLLQGNNFRASQSASSQDIERTIDLMHRRRSSQTHTTNDSHAQPGIMHQEQMLRSFESSVYDTHQML